VISSRSNTRIKNIRRLHNRKARQQSGLFLIEGLRLVMEAMQMGASLESLIYAPELLISKQGRALVAEQSREGIDCLEVSAAVFRSVAVKDNPQGIAAVVKQQWQTLDDVRPGEALCWIALDGAQDPGNLGSILRTGDAVGAAGVILLGDTTDPYHPTALRASMGAIFAQCLVRADFTAFVKWAKRHDYTLVGAAGDAPTSYRDADYRRPLVLLLGSEREGLSPEQRAACDVLVSLPMVGRSDSVNLAVATGIILYEIFHQRHATG
jgi:TrmH family RNA methyltransferase